ncbi:hypothetical protein GGR53DRAFT_462406 [Hypoxylon sp. FL1150]|nr:hypothetical protein GGR53DRAFT_462406 [Hypoxylon sp. FL1150]
MSAAGGTASPAPDFISISASKASCNGHTVLWLSASLMTIAFATRAYVRVACFRRLFIEDWFMFLSLCMFIANAALGTIIMQPLYDLVHLADGNFVPGPDFEENTMAALRGFAGSTILANLGVWTIKLSFLLFFYRFGHQLQRFLILWWFVFVVVITSGITQVGITQFDCMLGDIDTILGTCRSSSNLHRTHRLYIISVSLDIFTDFLIICFPISILWSSRITLGQKLVLSAVFSLVGFTIAVTVLRGGFSIQTEDLSAGAGLNVAFNFWFILEYLVAFLIACVISFRSLFVQTRNKAEIQAGIQAEQLRAQRERGGGGGLRRRMRELHDTLLDTCRELEGCDAECEMHSLPMPASGLMTVDFSSGETAGSWQAASNRGRKSSQSSARGRMSKDGTWMAAEALAPVKGLEVFGVSKRERAIYVDNRSSSSSSVLGIMDALENIIQEGR